MKDRIRQIMESQHMTQQVFADYIGLAPATLSSIFNGRTRPTLNVVEALKKKIPNINFDWLLLGTGPMYLDNSLGEEDAASLDEKPELRPMIENPMFDFDQSPSPTPQNVPPRMNFVNSVRNTRSEIEREELKIVDKPNRRVIEIRVFYDDQTWDTFVPAKK
ncbi:MAG: helix-turn-helix transcriptional regulator [Prevotella sp.]|nr:helix-turn-helix transcriptional regulator [Prevotella sp.]